MKNWHDDSVTISDECPWLEDSNDAMLVAQKLGIPFQTVDLSKTYKERIVDYMFREYEQGRTPNPDVLCNREIKFDVFMDIAMSLGADYVATGHYCRKDTEIDGVKIHRLLAGKDLTKINRIFYVNYLGSSWQNLISHRGIVKAEVRNIAAEQNLITAEKGFSRLMFYR